MGYFSNGTEGDIYEAQVCSKCVHHEDDPEKPGCPVMLVHALFAYEECGKGSNAERILSELIPRRGAFNAKCSMFITREQLTRKRREASGRLPGIG